ncbi:hypothetical protein [Neolewinella antarctica]|uniref:NADH dehydrogenase subunit 6 n=1 Tax=Neolewinella antarctica TaxID=442734 RepID=A0ABX0XE54_9BACT|nr:hypothetical protein [Neolewinella antarctica]NJC27593.1 hypothetical protein [Neolewinella antarctica]
MDTSVGRIFYRVATQQTDGIDVAIALLSIGSVIMVRRTRRPIGCWPYVVLVLLLGIVLPLWSSGREVDRNIAINGPAMDGFELLYSFIIIEVYWVWLALLLILMNGGLLLKIKPKNNKPR